MAFSTIFVAALCCFLGVASVAMGAAPRKPIDVPFSKNYVPTWAFDHIKYFNGGNEIQLYLDKYTGKKRKKLILISFTPTLLIADHCFLSQELGFSLKALTCLATSACR